MLLDSSALNHLSLTFEDFSLQPYSSFTNSKKSYMEQRAFSFNKPSQIDFSCGTEGQECVQSEKGKRQ